MRKGVDLYECYQDKSTGFEVEHLGDHPSEKVTNISWSPAGEIFAICEQEGMGLNVKNVWSTFLIVKSEIEIKARAADTNYIKWKGKMMTKNKKNNQLEGNKIAVYDFRKTARHEISDKSTVGAWDAYGRYFVIYGEKPRGAYIDKEKRGIRFFSMFGESIQ
jgi:hypothetical protein